MASDCPHGMPSVGSCVECMADGPVPAPKQEPEQRYTVTAKFDGHCTECNLPIRAGDRVSGVRAGRWIHAECDNGR